MGNMYWIAKWNQAGFFIQIFNFSTETFEPLASLPFDYGAYDVHNLSAFRGNNLSEKMEVWVTNMGKKGVIISWTKFFSLAFCLRLCVSSKSCSGVTWEHKTIEALKVVP
ncbi:hypothetical protein YC2023_030566 [Brassica napus]